jgi:hypothetical protein
MTDRPLQEETPEVPINADVEEAEASSRGSARDSSASPFVADPGPGFDPEAAGPEPEPPLEPTVAEQLLEIEWDEEAVGRWLLLQGELAHGVAGVSEADWKYTEADLISIAGPLSRILNRYETTRAIAAYNDPASVAFGFGMYGIRSLKERRDVLAALKATEEPITGVPAPPGSGPPAEDLADVEWKKP